MSILLIFLVLVLVGTWLGRLIAHDGPRHPTRPPRSHPLDAFDRVPGQLP